MIAIAAAMIAFALWTAVHRNARVDDAVADDGRSTNARWPDMRININTAGVAELSLLPGLGDRLAQRIVDDREANGPFATLADLDRVSGIGEATIQRLEPFATTESVNPAATAVAVP